MNEHHDRGGHFGRPHFDPRDGGRGRRRPDDFDPREGRGPGFGRMRRGDVRSALLIALLDHPGHGYELIQALEEKTQGRWRPSPGSVYPSLQLLADEGLVTSTEEDGKRTFELTDEGRAHAEEHVASKGLPWDQMDRGRGRGQHGELRSAIFDLHHAVKQVGMTASADTVEKVAEVLVKARKDIYRLLADS